LRLFLLREKTSESRLKSEIVVEASTLLASVCLKLIFR